MIPIRDAAEHFKLTRPRLKQIIASEKLKIVKQKNGYIKIPNKTMAALNEIRGIEYPSKIVTFGIQKGGTGKSVLTINTALAASRFGLKVLICDFDPECCASIFLAKDDMDWENAGSILEVFVEKNKQIVDFVIDSRFDGVDFLPSKSIVRKLDRQLGNQNPKNLLRKKLKGLQEIYDLILFDLPPSFNVLCSSAYLTSDLIICPVNSDVFSLESLHLTIEDIHEACEEFETSIPEIRVLKNRISNDKRRKATKEVNAELNKEFAEYLLPIHVKTCAGIENCLNEGISIFDAPKNEKGLEEIKTNISEIFGTIFPRDLEK